jgi:hypothetical protein
VSSPRGAPGAPRRPRGEARGTLQADRRRTGGRGEHCEPADFAFPRRPGPRRKERSAQLKVENNLRESISPSGGQRSEKTGVVSQGIGRPRG